MSDFMPTHRHYKGGKYQVLHLAVNVTSQHDCVVYRNKEGRVFVRDAQRFFEKLGENKGYKNRFDLIEKGAEL